jgi:predicted nuclease with TOPRIM domain
VGDVARAYVEACRRNKHLEQDLARLQTDYDAFVESHNAFAEALTRESKERLDWGTSLDRELSVRTEWAQRLDGELEALRARLEAAREEKAAIEGRLWTRAGRKLGMIG